MCRAVHIRASSVDRGVDHERSFVQKSVGPRLFEDISSVVNQDQIRRLDQREMKTLINIP